MAHELLINSFPNTRAAWLDALNLTIDDQSGVEISHRRFVKSRCVATKDAMTFALQIDNVCVRVFESAIDDRELFIHKIDLVNVEIVNMLCNNWRYRELFQAQCWISCFSFSRFILEIISFTFLVVVFVIVRFTLDSFSLLENVFA